MASFDDGIGRLRVAAGHVVTAANTVAGAAGYITGPWDRFTRWLRSVMPHGLYARALLIVIMPLVVLQSIVAFLFVERFLQEKLALTRAAVVGLHLIADIQFLARDQLIEVLQLGLQTNNLGEIGTILVNRIGVLSAQLTLLFQNILNDATFADGGDGVIVS